MSLAELTVENLRCLERADLQLHPARNLIWGSNGSGKTSLLESVFILGRGRSFRTRHTERLIRHGSEQLIVFGRTLGSPGHSVGVQVSRREGTVAKCDGAFAKSLAELSVSFPVQVIEPGVHKLIEEGAHRRRRWLDWAVFHVEPTFIDTWVRYTRVLKQRNAALKRDPAQAGAWDYELAKFGHSLAVTRRTVLERFSPSWSESIAQLTGLKATLAYQPGWNQEMTLAEALESSRDRDQARGATHVGPHRSDIVARIDGRPARDVLSRGQQKLAAIALITAQLRMIIATTGTIPTLLIDDPAAELDEHSLSRFLAEVSQLKCQLVFTSLTPHSPFLEGAGTVFHVEQGRVRPYNIAP